MWHHKRISDEERHARTLGMRLSRRFATAIVRKARSKGLSLGDIAERAAMTREEVERSIGSASMDFILAQRLARAIDEDLSVTLGDCTVMAELVPEIEKAARRGE